jgi:hypothetical protein
MSNKMISLPPLASIFKASVAAIPTVGGALDHLLFDGADELRIKNIEQAIKQISDSITTIKEDNLDVNWFSSGEALSVFRILMDKVQFECDPKKISAFSRIVVNSGSQILSKDRQKLSIVNHLSSLTYVQLKLLKTISELNIETRKVQGGALEQTIRGV